MANYSDNYDPARNQLGAGASNVSGYAGNTFLKQLALSAAGKGPSAAQELGRSQILENQRAMQSMAAGARGGNAAGAMRAAMGAGTDLGLRGMQQLAALRAQEQLAAQQVGASEQNQFTQAQEQARQGREQLRLQRRQQNLGLASSIISGIASTGMGIATMGAAPAAQAAMGAAKSAAPAAASVFNPGSPPVPPATQNFISRGY